MRRLRGWFVRFSGLFSKQNRDRELAAELESHLQLHIEENVRAGMSPEEARRQALIHLGGVEQTKENYRDRRGIPWLDTLWQDIRFGLRRLRKSPGFILTVIITLALAIGANTAMFSLVNALMLKSLPYSHPERIGTIYTRITGSKVSDERHNLNGEQWELLRDNVPALISAVSIRGASGVNLGWQSHGWYLRAGRVSTHYFDVLAVQPMMGRNFSEDEDRPHGSKAVILSNSLWRNTFNSNPNILGQSILLKGEPYTVIGVLPEGATIPLDADLYTALQASREGEGGGTNFACITRLRDGASWDEADAQINRAWSLRAIRYEIKENPGARVTYHSVPLQKGETARLRPPVLALMLAAGILLLIACANLAGLTLVHTLRRTPEVATRLALGAQRWQIQRQFWIENLLLAIVGGAFGVGVGFLTLRGLLLLLPEHFLPVAHVPLDGRVMGFTLAVSLLTSILFGMLPALATRSVDLRSSMSSRNMARGRKLRVSQGLIVGEVALTVVLLAASGLLIRTLVHLATQPPGFNPNAVMTAKASLDDVRFHDPAAFRKLLDESTAAMRQIPGVQNAAVGLSLPYERGLIDGSLTLSDGKEAGQHVETNEVYVTPRYFETLQIPVLMGRSFTEDDGPNAQRVAIVNRTFMRKLFHGANPVGRYVDKDMMIVGVVEDVPVVSGLTADLPLTREEAVYIPAAQVDAQLLSLVHAWFQPSWIVRTAGPVDGLTAQMQAALSSVDANLPFSGFYNVSDLLAKTLAIQRVEVALLGAMAVLALLQSAVGIFALVATVVAQRKREIGIRMALGSTVGRAVVEIGSLGAGASVLGMILGLMLCAGALPVMRSVLYGVGVYDAPTLATVVVTLLFVTLFATILPTAKLAKISPADTLREE
ncbi:MAG TPA: ADOP family duplicated permease [Candidatus Aquilonibacter sp.]|nr:ADOP family duplicated permease [Candidatus Aquilonibacter sp.]